MCSSHWKRWRTGNYEIKIDKKFIHKSFDESFKLYTKREENGCLTWTGPSHSDKKYGRTFYNGKRMHAHRAIYIHFKGLKNPKSHIHHKCGNKLCVEITHLEELSHFFHLKTHKRDALGRLLPYENS